jgi:hypothetical protein
MGIKAKIAIAHSDGDLGRPSEYTGEQLSPVKEMIREVAGQTMGGMGNIVDKGDQVLIKINTVIPVPANESFTRSPHVGGPDRADSGAISGADPDRRTLRDGRRHVEGDDGVRDCLSGEAHELCPFDNVPLDRYKIERPISFNEFSRASAGARRGCVHRVA